MTDRQTCVDCNAQSPETETENTLISAQHGWRLTRRPLPGGALTIEWRCPVCWRAHRARQGEPVPPSADLAKEGAPKPEGLGVAERVRAVFNSARRSSVRPRRG